MDDSAITCDEVIESHDKEIELFQKVLMERKQPVKRMISILFLHFY